MDITVNRVYTLGVDIARLGKDSTVFTILDSTNKKNIHQIDNIITNRTLTTETTKTILALNGKYNFKSIFIDAFGVGTGVYDQLLSDDTTKRKVIAIDHYPRV